MGELASMPLGGVSSCHELVHLRWVYFIFLGLHLLSYFSKLCLPFELGVHLTWVYFHFIGLHLLSYFSRLHLPFESSGKMGRVLSHEELFKGLRFSVVGSCPLVGSLALGGCVVLAISWF